MRAFIDGGNQPFLPVRPCRLLSLIGCAIGALAAAGDRCAGQQEPTDPRLPKIIVAGEGEPEFAREPMPTSDPAGQLKSYLRLHRFDQLLVTYVEQQLAAATDASAREALARELVSLYTGFLTAENRDSDAVMERLDQLSTRFPDAVSLMTQAAILVGKYRLAKSQFESWIWQRENDRLRQQVATQFAGVIDRAEQLRGAALRRKDEPGGDDTEIDRARQESVAIASQALYLQTWAQYYAAVTAEPQPSPQLFEPCRAGFRALLQIPDEHDIDDLKPNWFELDSQWSCRSVLGMALVCQAMGRQEQADYCFQLLGMPSVPAEVQSYRAVWQFHASYFPGQIERAAEIAAGWQQQPDVRLGRELWSTVAMAGVTWPDREASQAHQLALIGLAGLARENEFAAIDQLVNKHDFNISGDGFFAKWLGGYLKLIRSPNGSQDEMVQAAEMLAAALKNPGAGGKLIDRARCRYHYAVALFHASQFQIAAEQFRRVATMLRSLDPVMAEQAMWLRCQALDRLARTDSQWSRGLELSLIEFQESFPDSANADIAGFQRLMHDLADVPAETAIERLQRIAPGQPQFEMASYEICRLQHLRWNQAMAGVSAAASASADSVDKLRQTAAAVLAAAQRHLETHDTDETQSTLRHVKACLLAADVCLRTPPADLASATQWLDHCHPWYEVFMADMEISSEYHHLLMSLAVASNDRAAINRHASWLVSRSDLPAYRRAALIAQAQLIDGDVENSAGPEQQIQLQRAIEVYQALVDQFAAEQLSLADYPNAQVATWKLAAYLSQLGFESQALPHWRRLHESFPLERVYVLELARLCTRMRRTDDAVELWRKIVHHTRQGSEDWIEAKYNLIAIMLETDRQQAQQIYAQTITLVPEVPPPWTDRFAAVAEILNNK